MLKLVSEVRQNDNRSHSKSSFKDFVEEVSARTKIYEAASMQKFQEAHGNMTQLKFVLEEKIIPFSDGHGLNKCIDKNPASCCEHYKKITHSRSIPINVTSVIGHNTPFVDVREEGGLL